MRQSIQLLVDLWKIKELVHQQCEEIDKLNKRLDYKCRHLKRLQKNYQYLEEENRTFRLGRFAVLPEYRKQGLGNKLFKFVEQYIKLKINPCTIYFHGMAYLKDYYLSMGYEMVGDVFLEENIEHIEFRKHIK